MALAHLTTAALKAMREHGHPEMWDVAIYRHTDGDSPIDGVTIECRKCHEVLVELVNPDLEESA